MTEKIVHLKRTISLFDQRESFGFTVVGGKGTDVPAVVWSVERQGPADLSGKVQVGDMLVALNDELLATLSPEELVQKIISAPAQSSFKFVEDEVLRKRVKRRIDCTKRRTCLNMSREHQLQKHSSSAEDVHSATSRVDVPIPVCPPSSKPDQITNGTPQHNHDQQDCKSSNSGNSVRDATINVSNDILGHENVLLLENKINSSDISSSPIHMEGSKAIENNPLQLATTDTCVQLCTEKSKAEEMSILMELKLDQKVEDHKEAHQLNLPLLKDAADKQKYCPEIEIHIPKEVPHPAQVQGYEGAQHDSPCDELTVGSFAIVSYTNPPIFGTIRWIGTIAGIDGLMAGLELDEAMSGCTDGLSLHNMVRYFRCPPGRAYFCLLSCLENEKSFIFERMGSSPNSATGCLSKELVDNLSEVKEANTSELEHTSGGLNRLKYTQKCIEALHSHVKKLLTSKDRRYEVEIEQLQNELFEQNEKLQFEQELSKDVQLEVIRLFQQLKERDELQEKLKTEQLQREELEKEIERLTTLMTNLIQEHKMEKDQMKIEVQRSHDKEIDELQDKLKTEQLQREEIEKEVERLTTLMTNLIQEHKMEKDQMKIEVQRSHDKEIDELQDKLKTEQLQREELEKEVERLTTLMTNLIQEHKMEKNQMKIEVQRSHDKEIDELQDKLKTEVFHKEELEKEIERLTTIIATMTQEHTMEQDQMKSEVQRLHNKLIERYKYGEDLHGQLQRVLMEKEELHKQYVVVDAVRKDKEEICARHKAEIEQIQQELEQIKQDYHLKATKQAEFWRVPRTEVKVLEKSLGENAWECISEGMFRGQMVTVKCMHKTVNPQNLSQELLTMAHVRHPNLVLFMAAVLDDQGGPMIITELLDTTLRKAYEDGVFGVNLRQCLSAFQDIAFALHYLHELPVPIIHRNITSSNVFLEARANSQWKAKLSSIGCSDWVKHAITMADGSIVYTAPEAYPVNPSQPHKLQTTKIDVYSYGILLCEVMIGELPVACDIGKACSSMKLISEPLCDLMVNCTQQEQDLRPTMATVLQELHIISKLL